ncbi:MAG: hypothetical protein FJ295_19965 [Planctomycetes bacterium]|nr:hypothetical protein [Planctomycetota bacterium]
MIDSELRRAYERIQSEATQMAGGLTDLAQRAAVYHQLFHVTRGNHLFPVIAAHGALWARRYFAVGLRLAKVLSLQYAARPAVRQSQLEAVARFADTLRDINRRVCIDTYTNYHFVARYGDHSAVADYMGPELLEALRKVHAAARARRRLTDSEKRDVFQSHFLHEQRTIVGSTIVRAVADLDWPLVKWIALKPAIRFAYFPNGNRLWFQNFVDQDERVRNGMKAFEFAIDAGEERLTSSLRTYQTLPNQFFVSPERHYAALHAKLIATS